MLSKRKTDRLFRVVLSAGKLFGRSLTEWEARLWDIEVNLEMNMQPPTDDPDQQISREFAFQHTVSAAFEKQLGLLYDPGKLKKRPVPAIVVDHVELPTAN